jgi:hypothetical protein
MTPPGWSDFDPAVAARLSRSRGEPDAPCPLVGHDHRIPWAQGGYTNGTRFHGRPSVSFRVSPTYVLEDHLENFIVGHKLIPLLTGKAETWRLGNENSEDALSFNVFRSFQEAGLLSKAAESLVGVKLDGEPELIVWGNRLQESSVEPLAELKSVLDELEGAAGQQTEPDVIIHVAGWGWIFIEAKLSSPTSTYRGRPERLTSWRERYGRVGPFDPAALAAAQAASFPEQLLRNVAVAHRLAAGERVAVVALVRQIYMPVVRNWAGRFIVDRQIDTRAATWEQLYALTNRDARLADLRLYLANKSVNLRPAFSI